MVDDPNKMALSEHDSGDSSPVNQAIAEYLQNIRSADSCAFEVWLEKHGEFRDELLSFVDQYEGVCKLATKVQCGSETDAFTELGEYKLIREIGRGGMGVVFEAQQSSLNRRVAVKVLPLAATMDPRRVDRFRIESLAVASLDHPNIAEVYGMGYENGLHYFAMRLVEGQTLAEVIADAKAQRTGDTKRESYQASTRSKQAEHPLKQSEQLGELDSTIRCSANFAIDSLAGGGAVGYRAVAELIAVMADALDHAHQLGVIHRDIKPANIMIDTAGKPWVMDFGLAQIETEDGLTMTGDMVGTPRYMSPEQTTGKQPVDYRSDVHSLGATLYELLALTPAHAAQDRFDLLDQIRNRAPTSLSKLGRRIPPELESIVFKAMAKEPADRYATAAQFAADLRAWCEGRPIIARRVGTMRQIWRWSRRNPATTTLVATIGLLLISIAFVSTFAAVRLAHARDQLVEERDRALTVVESMTSNAALDSLLGQRELTESQRDFLTDVVSVYQELAEGLEIEPENTERKALAYDAIGRMMTALGRDIEAKDSFMRSWAEWQQLVARYPETHLFRRRLIMTTLELAGGANARGELNESERLYQSAISEARNLPLNPDADGANRYTLVVAFTNFSDLVLRRGTDYSQLSCLDEGAPIASTLCAKFPEKRSNHLLYSALLQSQARIKRAQGDHQEAVEILERALEQISQLSPPLDQEESSKKATLLDTAALSYRKLGEIRTAEEYSRLAFEIRTNLVKQFPASFTLRSNWCYTANNLAIIYLQQRRLEEAGKILQEGFETRQELNSTKADVTDLLNVIAFTANQGKVRQLNKDYEKAIERFDLAYQLAEDLLSESPGVDTAILYQRNVTWSRASCLDALGRHDEAFQLWLKAKELDRRNSQDIRILLAVNHAYRGQFDYAIQEAKAMIDEGVTDGDVFFNIAKIHSLHMHANQSIVQPEETIQQIFAYLRQSIQMHFQDAQLLNDEPAFRELRDRDEFRELQDLIASTLSPLD